MQEFLHCIGKKQVPVTPMRLFGGLEIQVSKNILKSFILTS
jgi:hypothetical protein